MGLFVAAGCGGAVATPAGTPAATVHLSADALKFNEQQLSVPANVPFAIEFENREGLPHNVVINGAPTPADDQPFSGPATHTIVFNGLTPGTYTFICAVHPDMKGTLAVGP